MSEDKVLDKGVLFTFTDFNKDHIQGGYAGVMNGWSDVIRAIAWGKETCPTTRKEHCQGFIQVYKQCRFAALKKMMGNCHFEVMKGSINQNEDYCSKEGEFQTIGKFVSKGYRSDLHNIKDDLKNGASMYDIMENYTGDFIRYHSGIEKMNTLIQEKNCPSWRDVETTALVGEAASGKTSFVYKKHGHTNIFKVDSGGDTDKFLFNGYSGQDVLLIDDFNGWIKYSAMLNILDGYPLPLNIKGGRTYARWTKVYITSNVKPIYWYKNVFDNFKRRITKCLLVTKGNTENLSHEEAWIRHEWSDTSSIESDPTCEDLNDLGCGTYADLSMGYS